MLHYAVCLGSILLSLMSSIEAAWFGNPQQYLHVTSQDDSIYDSTFDAFVEATLQEWHVPGLSIAVVDNGNVWSKGYGFASLQPDINATADTQYFSGSTTKAFTAAAMALLVHDEKYPGVKWASPVHDFIPADFALEDGHATMHTTIEDALSHRTGLPRHDLMYGQQNDTLSSVLRRVRYVPMTAEPRTLWQYCNIMFGVITDIVETITGQKLETVLRENFWKPLGMSSTTFTIPSADDEKSRLARGYYWDPPTNKDLKISKGQYVPEPYLDISFISGAGATISTVNDYALWIQAWLDAAESKNTSSPITSRIFHDLLTPRSIVTQYPRKIITENDERADKFDFITPLYYGLAWFTLDLWGETVVYHSGGTTGFGTQLYILPGRGYGIVTMANTVDTGNSAGAAVASYLLKRKLKATASYAVSASELQERLIQISNAHQHRPVKRTCSSRKLQTSPTKALPLPGSIADFAGQYSHPAYGSINLTVTTSPSASSEKILEGLLYPRAWPVKMRLVHESYTIFLLKSFFPHGLGDIPSGEDIVWEDLTDDDNRVMFELGLDGKVEMVGIPLDDNMVEMTRAKGKKFWREGLIWFEKV